MPLMICGSKDDTIVDRRILQEWQNYFKPGDRIWECPQGAHFFPQIVGKQILKFWNSLDEKQSNCQQTSLIEHNKIKV